MNPLPTPENIIKAGTYLYDETVLCDVCIVLSAVRFGTGDYEDPPEVADDVEMDTYYVWFGSTIARGHYNAGGGGWSSLAEAVADVESRPSFGKSVVWF